MGLKSPLPLPTGPVEVPGSVPCPSPLALLSLLATSPDPTQAQAGQAGVSGRVRTCLGRWRRGEGHLGEGGRVHEGRLL